MTIAQGRSATLSTRVALGTLWVGAAKVLVRGADLAVLLILSRILAPADFGLVAIAVSFVTVLDALTALPMSAALVRLAVIERGHCDTAFTLSLARAGVVAAMVVAAAEPFAKLYGDERLAGLLFVLWLLPVARGLRSPRLAVYAKAMDFRRNFIVDVAGKLAAIVLTLGFVAWLRSYWAIALSLISAPFAAAAVSYALAPYRPRLSLSRYRDFIDFLGWLSLAQLVAAINWQFDRLFLGRVAATGMVGLYSMAGNIAALPEQSVIRPVVVAPLLSSLSLLRDDPARLRRAYNKADQAILTLGLPALVALAVFAGPLVALLFDARWQPMAPLLTGLALAMTPALLRVPFRALAMSLGRTSAVTRAVAIDAAFRLPALVLGYWLFGIWGLIAAIGLASAAAAAVIMVMVRSLIGTPVMAQLRECRRPLLAACALAATGLLAAPWLVGLAGLALFAALAASLGAAMAAYGAVLLVLWCADGRPDGIEVFVLDQIGALARRAGGRPAPQQGDRP